MTHWVSFVWGTPLNHTDPTGHGECDGIQDPGKRASCQNANAATPTPTTTPTPSGSGSGTTTEEPTAAPVATPPPPSTPEVGDSTEEWVKTDTTYKYGGWGEHDPYEEAIGSPFSAADLTLDPGLGITSHGQSYGSLATGFQTRYVGETVTYTREKITTILGTDGKYYKSYTSLGEQKKYTDVFTQTRATFLGKEIGRVQSEYFGGKSYLPDPPLYYDP